MAIAGCSPKNAGNHITITYQTMESLPQQRAALDQLVAEFHATHPGIRIKTQTSPNGFQKLQALIAAGDPPDVFYCVSDRLPAFVQHNAVLDLNPFLAKDPSVNASAYFSKTLESCREGSGLYCFPFHFSTDVLFYNKDLFDKTGLAYPDDRWTWDDFAKTARTLTIVRDGKTVQYGTLQPRPLLLMKSYGGNCFEGQRCVIDGEAGQRSLAFLDSLVRSGSAPQTAALRDIEIMDGVTLFSTGRVGMLLGRTYMLVEFSRLKEIAWDVALVPKGQRRYSRLAVGGNCISSKTAHPQETWEFVKFFSGPQASRILGTFRNAIPALENAARSQVFLRSPPEHVSVFLEALDSAEIENPGMILWQEYLDKVLQPGVEEFLLGKMSIAGALQEMRRRGEDILGEEMKMHSSR